jgi:hypothetical protein
VRTSIVNGRKRSILIYKHFLDVDHFIKNVDAQIGFCASYYSKVDDRGADQNNGISHEEGTPITAEDIGASHVINSNDI